MSDEKLDLLAKALEVGPYDAKLIEGGPLQVEDLEPVMWNVTFEDGPTRYLGETKTSYWHRCRHYSSNFFKKADERSWPPTPRFQWWARALMRLYV